MLNSNAAFYSLILISRFPSARTEKVPFLIVRIIKRRYILDSKHDRAAPGCSRKLDRCIVDTS